MVETNDRSNRANGKAWPDEEFIGFMGGHSVHRASAIGKN